MATDIIKLVAKLEADGGKFADELNRATESVTRFSEESAKSVADMGDKVEATSEALGTTVSESFDSMAGVVDESMAGVAETVEESMATVSESVEGSLDGFADGMEGVAEKVEETATEAGESISDMGDAATEAGETIVREASEAADTLERDLSDAAKDAERSIDTLGTEAGKDLDKVEADTRDATTVMETEFSDAEKKIKRTGDEIVKHNTKSMDKVEKTSKKTAHAKAEAFASAAGRIGTVIAGIGAAITGLFALTGKAALDFKSEMSGIWAGVFDEERTTEAISSITEGLQDLSMKYGVASGELTEATRTAMGGGIELADTLEFLDQASMAAVAGLVDVKDIVQVTTAAMATFDKDASQANEVLATLGKTANWSNIEWSHLTTGIGAVLPTAKMAGMELEELGGTLAALTDRGLPPAQAMTYLNAAMESLAKPTDEQVQAFEQLGVALRDADGNARPFLDVMRDVDAKLKENPTMTFFNTQKIEEYERKLEDARKRVVELGNEMGSAKNPKAYADRLNKARESVSKLEGQLAKIRSEGEKLDAGGVIAMLAGGSASGRAMKILLDDMDNVEEKIVLIGQEAGGIEEQFRGFTMDNPQHEIDKFWETLKVITRMIGSEVLKTFSEFGSALSRVAAATVEWMRENPQLVAMLTKIGIVVGSVVTVLGSLALAAAGVAGAVAFFTAPAIVAAFGTIGAAIAAWAAPVLIIVGLIAAVAYGAYLIYKNWDSITGFFVSIWDAVAGVFVSAWNILAGIVSGAWGIIIGIISGAWEAIKTVFTTAFNIVAGIILTWFTLYKELFLALFGPIIAVVVEFWDGVKAAFVSAFEWLAGIAMEGWEIIKGAFMGGFNYVGGLVMEGWDWILGIWNSAVAVLVGIIEKIWAPFQWVIDKIKVGFSVVVTFVSGVVENVVSVFRNMFANIAEGWEAAKAGPRQFADWLVTSIKEGVARAMDILGELWDRALKLPGAIWDGMKDAVGLGDSGGGVPAMATGGIVRRPTIALIGEAGPEAVIPLNGGAIPVAMTGSEPGVSSAPAAAGAAPVVNVYQQPGEDGITLAKRIARELKFKQGWT